LFNRAETPPPKWLLVFTRSLMMQRYPRRRAARTLAQLDRVRKLTTTAGRRSFKSRVNWLTLRASFPRASSRQARV
jgi:hypothetical protein